MHDGTIAQGDTWLARHLPAILASSEYRSGTTAVFVTWDEGSGGYPVEDCAANTSDASGPGRHDRDQPEHPGRRHLRHPVQPLLPARDHRTAARPVETGQAASYPTMTAAFGL